LRVRVSRLGELPPALATASANGLIATVQAVVEPGALGFANGFVPRGVSVVITPVRAVAVA
jgi:hypothetical protein